MSHTSRRYRTASTLGSLGLPIWSGIAIVIAALATGMAISLSLGAIGTPFLACFAVAAIVVAVAVQARGLFLNVATMPLSFSVFTVLTSWLIGRQLSPNISAFSTTSLITAVYPLLQFFPVLILVVLGAAAIAAVRLWLLHRSLERSQARHIANRRNAAERDENTRRTADRIRQRTSREAPGGADGSTQPQARPAAHPVGEQYRGGYQPVGSSRAGNRQGARTFQQHRSVQQPYSAEPQSSHQRQRPGDTANSGERRSSVQPRSGERAVRPRPAQRPRPSIEESARMPREGSSRPSFSDRDRDSRYAETLRPERRTQQPGQPGQPSEDRQGQPSGDRQGTRRGQGQKQHKQVTVQELIARNQARRRRSESLNRDLYGD